MHVLTTQIRYCTVCRRRTYVWLERIPNILTRVVAGPSITSVCSTSSDFIYHLHWLPIDFRIKFKLAKLAFTFCSSSSPPYLASLVRPYTPSRDLRSSNTHLLTVLKYRLQIATRGFRVAAPTTFNSLPHESHDVRTASSLSVFISRLKSFYFKSAFSTLYSILLPRLRFILRTLAR